MWHSLRRESEDTATYRDGDESYRLVADTFSAAAEDDPRFKTQISTPASTITANSKITAIVNWLRRLRSRRAT
jgi:hypothetical protein